MSKTEDQVSEKLYQLIEKGNQDELYSFLEEQSLELDQYPHSNGMHPLHYAIVNKLADSADALIAYDDDCVNVLNPEGELPLHMAVRVGDPETIKVLLDSGAPINEIVRGPSVYTGYTALHFAASQGITSLVVQLLSRKDIDVSVCSNAGAPLHVAAVAGNQDIALLLIAHGASVTQRTPFGHSPLAIAASKASVSMCEFFLPKIREACKDEQEFLGVLNFKDKNGDTTLHLAVQSQCQRIFNYNYPLLEDYYQIAYELVLAGADVTIKNQEGDTPLDMLHPAIADITEIIAQNRDKLRSATSFEGLLRMTTAQLEALGIENPEKFYNLAQTYLKDPENCYIHKEVDPNGPPCIMIDSTKIPNIRKFGHISAEERAKSGKPKGSRPARFARAFGGKGKPGATGGKCPMGYGAEESAGKCPMGFGPQDGKMPPMDMRKIPYSIILKSYLKSSSFWIQTLGYAAVAGVVAMAIAKSKASAM